MTNFDFDPSPYNGNLAPRYFTRLQARSVDVNRSHESIVVTPSAQSKQTLVDPPVHPGSSIVTSQVITNQVYNSEEIIAEAAYLALPYRQAQIQIKFGDAKEDEYGNEILQDDIVVVPLFGAEANKTIYRDLMEGFQGILYVEGGSMEDTILAVPRLIPWEKLPCDTKSLILDRVCGYFGLCKGSCTCELVLSPLPGVTRFSQDVPEGYVLINVLFGTSRVLQYDLAPPSLESNMTLEHRNNYAICHGFNVTKDWWCAYNRDLGSVPGDDYNVTLSLCITGRLSDSRSKHHRANVSDW